MHFVARLGAFATFLILIVCFLFVPGCSGSYSKDLLRAEQAERSGKMGQALSLYQQALAKVPARDSHAASAIQLRIGKCHMALSQPTEAFMNYQKAVISDPQNLEARRRMAELLLIGGATEKATEELALILKANPNDAAATGSLGSAYISAGNLPAGQVLLEKSFSQDPSNTQVAIALAEVYLRVDRDADARKVLLQCASRSRQSDAWLALARLEEQGGSPESAEAAYRSAVQVENNVRTNLRLAQYLQRATRLDEAEKVLKHVDSLQASAPPALADFFFMTGRPLAATAVYAQKLLNGPKPNDPVVTRSIEARLFSGNSSGNSSDNPDTANDVHTARQMLVTYHDHLDPVTRDVLRAEVSLAEGNFILAEMHARSAVREGPASAPAHFILGAVLRQSGRHAEAKAAWNAGYQLDATYLPTRMALATEYVEEGDAISAEEHISPVVREEPANLQALVLYARVLNAQQRWDSAEVIAKRAIQVDANAVMAHVALGDAHMAQKQFGVALADYQHALVIDSQSVPALNGLMSLYRKGAVTRQAIQKMEVIAEQPPASAALLEVSGRLYADRGYHQDAARALQKALKIEPDRSSAALAVLQLKQDKKIPNIDLEVSSAAFKKTMPAIAELLQARDAERRNDRVNAIQHYEAALRMGEYTGAAANNLAWIYSQQGVHLDRALELARRASELDSKNPSTWDTLGTVLLKRRDYTAASEVLASAVALSEQQGASPQSRKQIYLHLADAYNGAGLPQRADEIRRKLRE